STTNIRLRWSRRNACSLNLGLIPQLCPRTLHRTGARHDGGSNVYCLQLTALLLSVVEGELSPSSLRMAVMGDHTHSTSQPGWRLTAAKYMWLASFLLIAARIAQKELQVAFLPSSSTAAYLALIAMGLFQALLSVEDRCRLPQFILMAAGSF